MCTSHSTQRCAAQWLRERLLLTSVLAKRKDSPLKLPASVRVTAKEMQYAYTSIESPRGELGTFVVGAPRNVLLAANAVWAAHASLRAGVEQSFAEQ